MCTLLLAAECLETKCHISRKNVHLYRTEEHRDVIAESWIFLACPSADRLTDLAKTQVPLHSAFIAWP